MTVESLWGDIPRPNDIRSPAVLLREQADILTNATSGLLEGRIEARKLRNGNLSTELDVVAPALNGYAVTILSIQSGLRLYPVVLRDSINEDEFEVTSEEQFKSMLRDILSSSEVRSVIGALLTQSAASG